MPIVTQCTAPGCETLTMGPLCIEHEQLSERLFVGSRSLVRVSSAVAPAASAIALYAQGLRTALERPVAAPRHR